MQFFLLLCLLVSTTFAVHYYDPTVSRNYEEFADWEFSVKPTSSGNNIEWSVTAPLETDERIILGLEMTNFGHNSPCDTSHGGMSEREWVPAQSCTEIMREDTQSIYPKFARNKIWKSRTCEDDKVTWFGHANIDVLTTCKDSNSNLESLATVMNIEDKKYVEFAIYANKITPNNALNMTITGQMTFAPKDEVQYENEILSPKCISVADAKVTNLFASMGIMSPSVDEDGTYGLFGFDICFFRKQGTKRQYIGTWSLKSAEGGLLESGEMKSIWNINELTDSIHMVDARLYIDRGMKRPTGYPTFVELFPAGKLATENIQMDVACNSGVIGKECVQFSMDLRNVDTEFTNIYTYFPVQMVVGQDYVRGITSVPNVKFVLHKNYARKINGIYYVHVVFESRVYLTNTEVTASISNMQPATFFQMPRVPEAICTTTDSKPLADLQEDAYYCQQTWHFISVGTQHEPEFFTGIYDFTFDVTRDGVVTQKRATSSLLIGNLDMVDDPKASDYIMDLSSYAEEWSSPTDKFLAGDIAYFKLNPVDAPDNFIVSINKVTVCAPVQNGVELDKSIGCEQGEDITQNIIATEISANADELDLTKLTFYEPGEVAKDVSKIAGFSMRILPLDEMTKTHYIQVEWSITNPELDQKDVLMTRSLQTEEGYSAKSVISYQVEMPDQNMMRGAYLARRDVTTRNNDGLLIATLVISSVVLLAMIGYFIWYCCSRRTNYSWKPIYSHDSPSMEKDYSGYDEHS